MTRYVLNRDLTVTFRGYPVSAKKGAPCTMLRDGLGNPCFAIRRVACDAGAMGKAGTWSIFGHDSKYFYVWVPSDAVSEESDNA
ncbi:hypothetical protein HDIA_0727 [Hartmannibacter diazotrophicus]|uniref:Uncharacterized protein n=1 Tax=Hartmannibacter diazotrophicus TaxID=1482074 RepID=A0A2C9D293_9HYPH|nr:hypothetical protein [Hartmannibacter diazotrophicus]SON54268.1 hypothetical protein HDIA_0727 [Hartmannibacter diazotrophicus]